ncbi:MBL fold metallo-hydrolase [Bacteroidota bacterium]
MMKFFPLGGTNEIGANCYYLNLFGTGLLLDCGIHPRKINLDSLPKFELLENLPVDFVIISHAHQDHIGSLPYLIQKYPHARIFSTPQTREIAELALHNSANILRKRLSKEDDLIPYTHDEIDLLVKSIKDYSYNEKFSIRGLRHNSNSNIEITFFDAGHILGSAAVLIEINGKRIFYTGDINLSSQEILAGAELPIRSVDVLISETTYAGTISSKLSTWSDETRRFANAANKILAKGGSILIPVFALGKTQEILFVISNLIKKGMLTEVSIFSGGISRKYSRRYDNNRYKVKRSLKDYELWDIPQEELYDVDILAAVRKNPSIVLASSGMMIEGTKSFELIKEWIKYKSNGVFIVGYMDPETPGYLVMNAGPGDSLQLTENSNPIKVNCRVERFYFPSHSKREELLEIVNKLTPGRVVLVHGEQKAVDWMGMKILEDFPTIKVNSAELGRWITF